MEESFSKEELGKALVARAMQEIESWANKELRIITYRSQQPICVSISKNTWLVGHYRIVKNKRKQFAVYSADTLVNKFVNKQAAFLFASMDKMHKFELSNRILNSDRTYSRIQEELKILAAKQEHYVRTKNYFKLSLIEAKLSHCSLNLQSAAKDLEKNLNRAKYVKVWD